MNRIDRLRLIFITNITLVVLLVVNYLTQAQEDNLSLIQRDVSYLKDLVWYLDDIIAPGLFMAGAVFFFLFRVGLKNMLRWWPLTLLAATFFAIGAGDTLDAHWVYADAAEASKEMSNFSSYISKIICATVTAVAVIYSAPLLETHARKNLFVVFFLVTVNLLILSVGLDFGGYAFHVFEESYEVAASLLFLIGVTRYAVNESMA